LNLFCYFPLSFLLHTYNLFFIQQNQIIFLQYKLYQLTFLLTTLQWLSIIHLEKNTDSFPDLSNKTFHKSVLCIYISSCMFLLYLYLSSSQNALPLSSSHLLFFIHTKLILILDILYLLFPLPVPELYGSSSCSSDLGLNVFSQSDHPCSTNLTRATMSQVMYFLKFFVLH